MTTFFVLLAAALLSALTIAPRNAHAHPGEFLRALTLHPSDPQTFVIRYEAGLGGLLLSRDGGKTVQIVPGQGFYKYPLRWHVPMQIASDGKLMLAVDYELRIDGSGGCGLEQIEPSIALHEVADLAPHPSDASITYAVTTNEGTPTHRGLWRRDAQGVFTPFGTSDVMGATLGETPFRPTSLKVVARSASSGGVRFIEAGLVADAAVPSMRKQVLRVSDDMGASWTTHAIPNPGNVPGTPRVLLVAPGDPLQVIVALEVDTGELADDRNDPIYLTKDGGQSFTLYTDQLQVLSAALQLPSGQILLADRGTPSTPGALWSASSFGGSLTKVHDMAVTCLAYQASTQKVFMCHRQEFGLYDPASNAFCAIFTMSEVTSMVSCPAAPLENNSKVVSQLCSGFCDARHFASAPLCSSFDKGTRTFCGPVAAADDRSAGYVEPPGPLAAPRCTGFTAPAAGSDAGVEADADSPAEDAGSEENDGGQSKDDDGVPDGEDAEDDENDEAGESDDALGDGEDEDEDAATTRKKKKGRGCHCTMSDTRAPHVPLGLALGLALAFYVRRRARD